ncbi:Zn-ribbon domain-containing OB-fold protein [Frankia sp. R43]|uniref:Zn-ribbon domain-containing OB-fold protein n=1 Tax=Frankia sp. R43 TaxID=269536 RepID=UPI0009F9C3AA|nr:OB-fold domain-containing protein [Frankia sp. R43]
MKGSSAGAAEPGSDPSSRDGQTLDAERVSATHRAQTGTISPIGDRDFELLPAKAGIPFAPRTPLTEPFWAGCARGELLFQRCADCGYAGFPPAVACRACLSRALRWERSAGGATLYSWTVVHRPVSRAFRTPYAPAIVTVDEGYQMMTCLVGLGVAAIQAGMRLRAVFHEIEPGTSLPYFSPSTAPSPPSEQEPPCVPTI